MSALVIADDGSETAETPAERDAPVLRLPKAPDPAGSVAFPWLMLAAPALGGAAMFAMTGSPIAIVFTVLGPVLALANLVEQVHRQRRTRQAANEAFDDELDRASDEADRRLVRAAARRLAEHPRVGDVVAGRAGRLVEHRSNATRLALGLTDVPSGLRLDASGVGDDPTALGVVARAGVLTDMPYLAETSSVCVCGPRDECVATLLGLIVDALFAAPRGVGLELVNGPATSRVRGVLERAGLITAGALNLLDTGTTTGDAPRVRLAAADRPDLAPADVAAVMTLEARGAVVRLGGERVRVRPEFVTPATFEVWARGFLAARRVQGLDRTDEQAIPSSVTVQELGAAVPPEHARTAGAHLAAPIGRDAAGPVWIDLVEDGPHAVIGGTTGTGKSELLRGWLTALARRYPATHFTWLGIDFKGGATFDDLAELPHGVGIVTDLDGGAATRVLDSLAAELRRRERVLRDRGVRDLAALEPGAMPRLVIVVDEFQALLDEHRELHDTFADLAARGRSLGMHLILCAQRPAGAARDSLLGNCTIRISLRVTSPHDSHLLLGVPDAASIDAVRRGRGIVLTGEHRRHVQFATTDRTTIAGCAAERRAELERVGASPPDRPWLPALPEMLRSADLDAPSGPGRVVLGRIDDPPRQAQPPLELVVDGGRHLVVLGASGQGKSSACRIVAERCRHSGVDCLEVPADPEGAWDALDGLLQRTADEPLVVVLDDLDQRAAAFGDEHRTLWSDRLAGLVRRGSTAGLTFVASAQRPGGELQALLGHAAQVVRLGAVSRQEFVLSGGEATAYRPGLPPGRGVSADRLVQFAAPSTARTVIARSPVERVDATRVAAIVTRHPRERLEWCAREGVRAESVPRPGPESEAALASLTRPDGPRRCFVGEPDEWQQSFGLLARVGARADLALDDLSPAQIRVLLGGEQPAPPIARPRDTALVRRPDGTFTRQVWGDPRS